MEAIVTADHVFTPPTLAEFADRRCNELYDVVVLLHAVEDRIEAERFRSGGESAHQTLRLVQMARERIDQTAAELFDHIS